MLVTACLVGWQLFLESRAKDASHVFWEIIKEDPLDQSKLVDFYESNQAQYASIAALHLAKSLSQSGNHDKASFWYKKIYESSAPKEIRAVSGLHYVSSELRKELPADKELLILFLESLQTLDPIWEPYALELKAMLQYPDSESLAIWEQIKVHPTTPNNMDARIERLIKTHSRFLKSEP